MKNITVFRKIRIEPRADLKPLNIRRTPKLDLIASKNKIKKIKKKRYKLTYENYIDGKRGNWINIRKKALKLYKNRCCACDSIANLHVHHATYARLFNEKMEDLRVLCKYCHDYLHLLHEKAGKPELSRFTDDFINSKRIGIST